MSTGYGKGGRGSGINPTGRYEEFQREVYLEDREEDLLDEPALQTTVIPEKSKSIITKNSSPDIPFNRSINPYRGCEHGCAYCYARPTHTYMGLSAGIDFETQIFAKDNAPELLEKEFRKPRYKPETIVIGANTDPYQPVEKQKKLTRALLEICEKHSHPVALITKSSLILRDRDILARLAAQNLVSVAVSVTTLNSDLARRLEPRAAGPAPRIRTIQELSQVGIPVTVMAAPMIPALNDIELESILETAYEAGARDAGYVLLRLPHEIKDIIIDWLDTNFPTKKDHILKLLRTTRDGELYQSQFGNRMRGTGEYADLLEKRFRLAAKRLGFGSNRMEGRNSLELDLFRSRPEVGLQLGLFG